MENQPKKPRTETKLLIFRLQDYLFTDYEYQLNVISNIIQRKLKSDTNWETINMSDIHIELYEAGMNKFKEILNQLFGSRYIARYDPFCDYFESLDTWSKQEEDHIAKLASYIHTDDQVWWSHMFKKWLVRVAGQATTKIPFNKQCLTLVGKQNDGKTTFIDFLVPHALKDYVKKGFTFGSKEGKFSLVQNFLVNLDELASFDKKDLNNEFKSVLSESYVKFRLLFQNVETPLQRRASFAASTNRFEFLTDETGNVRWLPFIVKNIQHDCGGANGYQKNVNIDRVWAQAYALLNDPTFDCNMTPGEIKHQELLNRRFLTTTTEMEVVSKYFDGAEKGDEGATFMTVTEMEEYLKTRISIKLYRPQIGKALQVMNIKQESNYNPKKGYSEKGYYLIIK